MPNSSLLTRTPTHQRTREYKKPAKAKLVCGWLYLSCSGNTIYAQPHLYTRIKLQIWNSVYHWQCSSV
jgi:hypothetical protein